MTVSELLYEWLEQKKCEHMKLQTYMRYQGLIRLHILPSIGGEPIETLTRRQVSDLLARHRQNGNRRPNSRRSSSHRPSPHNTAAHL